VQGVGPGVEAREAQQVKTTGDCMDGNETPIRIRTATSRATGNTWPDGVVYESLLSEAETIDRLGLHDRPNPTSALRWLTRTRRLPFVRIGRGIVRFRPADVQDFIEAHYEPAK
jgi:hypothetical protein